jgi:putative membrane protein
MRGVLWSVYAVMWIGGVVSGGVSKDAPWAAPFFLAIAGVLAVAENRAAWKHLVLAALIGMVFELAGVHTGLPFGRYAYTNTLAPSLLGVPIAIAFAWLVLIDFVRGVTQSPLWGALLMTAIDFVIDPLAAGPLHYWRWLDSGPYYGIPWINFVGWLLASLVILNLLPAAKTRSAWVGLTVVAFFAVMALELKLWLPGLLGCGIVIGALPWPRIQQAEA